MLYWMQHSWAQDYEDTWKLHENGSYLTASFMNPEGVKKAIEGDKDAISTTDEEFDKTSEWLKDYSNKIEEEKAKLVLRRRKRRPIK